MITMENKLKDVKEDPEAAQWLEHYSSVPQINRLFRLIAPFRFKTLQKIAPKGLKSGISSLVNFFNGADDVIGENDPRSILLWDKNIPLYSGGRKPYIVPFLLKDQRKAPAVIIAPGGAYVSVTMDHEGVQVAERFNQLGFHSIVLNYRVSPSRYPCMQLDLIRAIQIVRANAEKWNISENQIILIGFSAGGHLVMSINGLYEKLRPLTGDLSYIDGKPNALIGGYPMIDLKCKMFNVTCDMIFLGKNNSEKLSGELSVQNLINENYPPTFMFAMENDPLVPPTKNCLLAKEVLDKNNVANEVCIYSGNVHGFGLAEGQKAGEWVESSINFLKKNGII